MFQGIMYGETCRFINVKVVSIVFCVLVMLHISNHERPFLHVELKFFDMSDVEITSILEIKSFVVK